MTPDNLANKADSEAFAQPAVQVSKPVRKLPLKQMVKIVLSLVVLGFLLHYTGIENTIGRLSQANLWYLPAGVMLYLLAQVVSSYRWRFLSRPLGFELSLREFYDFYLIGMFFNLFLPGAIGGDALRMYYLARRCDRKKREALLTLLAERGVGLVALLIMTSAICLTPAAEPVPMAIRVGLVTLSLAGFAGFMVLRSVPLDRLVVRYPRLELLLQAKVYWDNMGLLVKSVSISLLVHCTMVFMHWLVASALHVSVPFPYLAVVYGTVSLVSVLPFFFNGIGMREGAYTFLLTRIGLTPETALAFGLYWFLISTCTSLLGGLVLVKGHYRAPSPQEAEAITE